LSIIYFFKLQDYKKAQDNLSLFLNSNDTLAEGWCLLGDFLIQKKNYADAKKAYELAISKGKNRQIYDNLPIWTKRYSSYPAKKIEDIGKLFDSMQVMSLDKF
jgi:tetratricopeptide (TPR) repeat protein